MKIDFSKKTAIVTGGTRGIGKSIVSMLIESGCHVIYTGTKKQPKSPIKKGQYEQLDLSDKKSIDHFVKEVVGKTSRIDVLINNAGINIIESIDEVKYENWEKILAVNLTGPMHLMKAVAKTMKKNKPNHSLENTLNEFSKALQVHNAELHGKMLHSLDQIEAMNKFIFAFSECDEQEATIPVECFDYIGLCLNDNIEILRKSVDLIFPPASNIIHPNANYIRY